MFVETKDLTAPSLAVEATFPRPAMEGTVGSGEPVMVSGAVVRVQAGLRFTGRLETSVAIECARCTSVFRQPVATEFTLLYTDGGAEETGENGELLLSEEDCSVASLDEQGRIDLLALTREQVYLALPLKPVCSVACRGLCDGCGVDLNVESCRCPETSSDPRLAVLAELKNRF
jgi:uncharacterized protein